jgi:hypothetical protein
MARLSSDLMGDLLEGRAPSASRPPDNHAGFRSDAKTHRQRAGQGLSTVFIVARHRTGRLYDQPHLGPWA